MKRLIILLLLVFLPNAFAKDVEKTFVFDQPSDFQYLGGWVLEQRYSAGRGRLDKTYPVLIEDIYDEYSAVTEYSTGDRAYVKPLDAVVTTEWAAITDFSLNDLIVSGGYAYQCTTDAGSSGETTPTFPATRGETVEDGDLVWTCVVINRVEVTFYESLIDANTDSYPPDHISAPYYPTCTPWGAATAYAAGQHTAPVNDYVYQSTIAEITYGGDPTHLTFVDGGESADTLTDSEGRFITDGFKPGMTIIIAGATTTANDGNRIIVDVAAGTLTLATGSWSIGETGAVGMTITATTGISGETEPVWPTTTGVTVEDGDVTWECMGANLHYPTCTPWAAATAFAAGQHTAPANDYVYKCTVAGTSGETEPVWPTTTGVTVEDGGVTWECMGANPFTSPDGGYETRTVTWEAVTEDIEFTITLSVPEAISTVLRYFTLRSSNRDIKYESSNSNQVEGTFEIPAAEIMKPLFRGMIRK